MTAAASFTPDLRTRLVNGVLSIKPLANFAKHRARTMMIQRAEAIGVTWTQTVQTLMARGEDAWAADLAAVETPDLDYPDYYCTSFHAYEQGNLSWQAATEVEVAARAVHARIWPEAGAAGDERLRQSYHKRLQQQVPTPQTILDMGCSVGMSTFALQDLYPQAQLTGLDLSPYFLAVAQYNAQQQQRSVQWVHRPAEQTELPDQSFDLVSLCLVCHELPDAATHAILREAYRLLRPQGFLAIMDMNPHSEFHRSLPPYVLTLLKSTEPYLDQYFGLDLEAAIAQTGFTLTLNACNSPRHRTVIAQRG